MEEDLGTSTEVATTTPQKSNKGATHIFQALQYLRRLCNHPLLVVSDKYPNYQKVNAFLQKTNTSIHDLANAPKLLALK